MNNKIIVGIGGGIAAVIIVAVFTISFGPVENGIQPQIITKNEKLGLVINSPTTEVTIQQLDEIYEKAMSTGIGRSNVYLFWNLIEPEKGEYDFQNTDILINLNRKHDFKVTLYFSVINGGTLGPFPDWIGKPTLNSLSEDNLFKVLDVILTRYDIIDSVIIAGQTDEHFRHKENSIPVYKEFFNNVYDKIKEKHPDVKIGNSFSLHSVINKNLEHIVSELNIGDFIAFTYFPVDSLYEISKNPHDEARNDLEKIFELVPDKKIAIFEISWSTSEFVGGNEESQEDFVLQAFDFYKDNESKIEYLTWYRQYDRPEGTCTINPEIAEESFDLVAGNEFIVERLSHYVCNAGLLDVDGKPKPGWNEFKKQIKHFE